MRGGGGGERRAEDCEVGAGEEGGAGAREGGAEGEGGGGGAREGDERGAGRAQEEELDAKRARKACPILYN